MSSNTSGKLFTITSFGESHGPAVGIVVDGCPAGIPLDEADIQPELDRRKPGQSPLATHRREEDRVEILSGVFSGHTTGAPICMLIRNENTDPAAYEDTRMKPRPGHADYTAYVKYGGLNDHRGGGRFSGRITAGFVMAGAVAKKALAARGIYVFAHTVAIGDVTAAARSLQQVRQAAGQNLLGCADPDAAVRMAAAIETARREGNSLGGIIEAAALGVPAGLGEPVFGGIEAELARGFFAIPAVKGVEFGAGFAAAGLKGSENNDPFVFEDGEVATSSNNAGGILGGISNGQPIIARLAFKPTPSISREQRTVDLAGMTEVAINIRGRHDPCIVPRAVVVAEAMMAVVLCDLALQAGILTGVMK